MSKKKWIEIKKGNKTTHKLVPDDYQPEEDFSCSDIAANGGYLQIGIGEKRYQEIFGKKELNNKTNNDNI